MLSCLKQPRVGTVMRLKIQSEENVITMHVLVHSKSLNNSTASSCIMYHFSTLYAPADNWIHARSADRRSRKLGKFKLWPPPQPHLNWRVVAINMKPLTKMLEPKSMLGTFAWCQTEIYGRVRALTSQPSQFTRHRWALLPWKRLAFPHGLLARFGGKEREGEEGRLHEWSHLSSSCIAQRRIHATFYQTSKLPYRSNKPGGGCFQRGREPRKRRT